jgi:hypothetical protein
MLSATQLNVTLLNLIVFGVSLLRFILLSFF